MNPILIKIGGNEIDDPAFLRELAATIGDFNMPVVIVHGGGKEITQLQQMMGITPQYVDGLRVTDAPSLAVVEMVLCGLVNKRLVRTLVNAGVDAIGMSGVDQGLVRAVQMRHDHHDMGFTGEIVHVRGEVISDLLLRGITPVIAPVCLGDDAPTNYNVNADHVAGAIAAAIQAERIVFLTNVEGVLVNHQRVAQITEAQAHSLIEDGTISGGMIPKVKTALSVLRSGVSQAAITDLTGLKSHGGTVFTVDSVIV